MYLQGRSVSVKIFIIFLDFSNVDEKPGYSLYKPNILNLPEEYPRTSPDHSQYPNSLIEIVEDLEINSGYEERCDEAEEPDYYSDEEESTVLDKIFFLKR